MPRYLTHAKSEQSAGWYTDPIARVLLDSSADWTETEPPAGPDGGVDVTALSADERKQHEALQAGHVLTDADLHPEQAPVTAPAPPAETGDTPSPVDDTNPGESADNEGN
jgi:hypothetical protein